MGIIKIGSKVKGGGSTTALAFATNKTDEIKTVSQLTAPSLNKGAKAIHSGDGAELLSSDGSTWYNLSNSKTAPWWLPDGAVLHIDFVNSRFYWDGDVKELTDLTAVTGGYTLNYGFGFVDTAWIEIEFNQDNETADGTGHLFSWTSGYPAGNRLELSLNANATYGNRPRIYLSPGNPSADYQSFDLHTLPSDATAYHTYDNTERLLFKLESNEFVKYLPNNGTLIIGDKKPGTLAVPTKLGFGVRVWAASPDQPLIDATLRRVTIWNSDLTNTNIDAIGRATDKYPLHLLGDSFLNNYRVMNRVSRLLSNNNYRIGISQDGVGATSLTQQAVRYDENNENWHESTLVICDFGFDGTAEDAITAIQSILTNIKHDRWLYMQAAPSEEQDPVTALTSKDSIVKDFVGNSHWVSTLQEAWDMSDGSPEDEAEIVKGVWPLSLKTSVGDFHPNEAGQEFIANLIYNAVKSRGWISKSTSGNGDEMIATVYPLSTGTTAERPKYPYMGQRYFDTTLGYNIDFNGINWVDATGTTR